ncbi:hypothetical protein NXS19_005242 [Fusarium pseudograminearum]|uniref:Uncharacterized protein n=1 Tax=Fusarium pseudograminearum (strain CS3096) TaxID=1028729 RepID=K3VBF9_FUSPC|nr:hypothetical protein FPSE_10175 [Fusarium pseudograminearum CS3096]EKJ69638.1 hypothetical protein FPSE_10175 [Fusarium pseudograminearum CS3096]UZP37426.1 hypothetical protein NXS19_005242 [Fusarium pseudograminearum]
MTAAVEKHFSVFLDNAKLRSGQTVQSWEQEKTSLVLDFDTFYKHECSSLPSDLPEQALTVLKRLHARAKEGIEAMFNTCKASQRKDADDFGTGLTKLASTVKKTSDKEILRLEDEAHKSRLAVESFKRQIKSRLNDSREPESVEVVEDRREKRAATPISGGMGFDIAHRRATGRGPRTPSSQTRAQRILAQRQAPTLPVVLPVSRNVPARSPTRVPARSVVQGASYRAPSPATVSPAMRTTSTARKSQAPKGMQSEELGDIHPIMEETMRLGSAISQEYEDNLHMLDEEQSEWENMDEIDEVLWQSSEDSPQDDSFEDLSARNSRLSREKSRLNKEIASLHEENEKFQEIIEELKGSNEMLTRENEDLRMYTGNQGQPAGNANQIGIDEDLDFPTSLPRVPTIPHTPTTAGIPGSPLSTPRAHNISTDTSKMNSPLTPLPLARAATNDSIRSDWGKPIGTHFPGSLHRSDTSDMASPDDVGPYTGTMSDVMALLRSAVVRCNKDIQTCHKEKKTSPGHETPTNFLFESWEDSARRNRHDFRQTISYFQTISGKSSSKSRSHASSSSLGGSPRSVGSSFTATNTFKSFGGDFAEGVGWDSPAFVPPKSGNAPGLTNPEGKLHEPKTAQESPPMEGSVDKKGSTQGGSSSTSGGSSKKSQSNPKGQPQNSQKSSGSRTGTGGTKSSIAHGEKRGDDDDDDNDDIVRSLTHPMLEKYRHTGMHPLFVAIILYLAVRWSSFKFWVDQRVRRPMREYITRKLPSRFSSLSTAIAMIMLLITGFFYLYFKTYLVYLVVQKERQMWRDGNNVAMRLELKRAGKPSGVSLWGLSEEQGLVRQSVGDFVEFICWSLGFTALKNSVSVWALNMWAVVSDSASFAWEVCCWALATTNLVLGNGVNTAMHRAKLVFVGGN